MPHIVLDQVKKDVQNIYCVARNYAKHAAELNNAVPVEPVFFMKPNTSILLSGGTIQLPSFSSDVQHEVEVVVYIDQNANYIAPQEALSVVGGYGVGLDLTARDAREDGLPWLKSKGFRHASCLSNFVDAKLVADPENLDFELKLNGETVQKARTSLMINSIAKQISYPSEHYGLREGDLIYTGTPEGVGRIRSGDKLALSLSNLVTANFQVG